MQNRVLTSSQKPAERTSFPTYDCNALQVHNPESIQALEPNNTPTKASTEARRREGIKTDLLRASLGRDDMDPKDWRNLKRCRKRDPFRSAPQSPFSQ